MRYTTFFHQEKMSMKVYPLEPHFYIGKTGVFRIYLFFLFLLQNIDCGYSLDSSNVYQNKKNIKRFSVENFQFLQLKKNQYITWTWCSYCTADRCLCILNRQTCVMRKHVLGIADQALRLLNVFMLSSVETYPAQKCHNWQFNI